MVTSYAKYEFVAIGFFTLEGARVGRYPVPYGRYHTAYKLKSVPSESGSGSRLIPVTIRIRIGNTV
jgi:hypothetical protein